jgi:hypothetical protein
MFWRSAWPCTVCRASLCLTGSAPCACQVGSTTPANYCCDATAAANMCVVVVVGKLRKVYVSSDIHVLFVMSDPCQCGAWHQGAGAWQPPWLPACPSTSLSQGCPASQVRHHHASSGGATRPSRVTITMGHHHQTSFPPHGAQAGGPGVAACAAHAKSNPSFPTGTANRPLLVHLRKLQPRHKQLPPNLSSAGATTSPSCAHVPILACLNIMP